MKRRVGQKKRNLKKIQGKKKSKEWLKN